MHKSPGTVKRMVIVFTMSKQSCIGPNGSSAGSYSQKNVYQCYIVKAGVNWFIASVWYDKCEKRRALNLRGRIKIIYSKPIKEYNRFFYRMHASIWSRDQDLQIISLFKSFGLCLKCDLFWSHWHRHFGVIIDVSLPWAFLAVVALDMEINFLPVRDISTTDASGGNKNRTCYHMK